MPSTYRELERQWEERLCFLPNPGQLLTAPDSWTVSSVARHGQPPTMHAATVIHALTWNFLDDIVQVHDTHRIEPPGGKGLGPHTPHLTVLHHGVRAIPAHLGEWQDVRGVMRRELRR